MALNSTQQKVLVAVQKIGDHGDIATVDWIADKIGFSDTEAIRVWLKRLTFDQYLTVDDGAYKITEAGLKALSSAG